MAAGSTLNAEILMLEVSRADLFLTASVMMMGLLFTLNLGFFRKLIFLFIFSMILKLACFSDSFKDCK